MTNDQIVQALVANKFLRGMHPRLLASLAPGAKARNLPPDTPLAEQGQPAGAFYLVLSGHIAIRGRDIDPTGLLIQTAGPGEPVGWSWLIPPNRWQFDCRSLDAARCLAFDGHWLRELCEADHELGYELLKRLVATIASRLAASRCASFVHQLHPGHR